jgi:hypothetical protein
MPTWVRCSYPRCRAIDAEKSTDAKDGGFEGCMHSTKLAATAQRVNLAEAVCRQ